MSQEMMIALATVLVLGVGAQWIAWRFSIPSILLLLVFGIVAGPVAGIVHPSALMGDLLLPAISLSVSLILFEGGLSLRFGDLRRAGAVVPRLVTVGAIVSLAVLSLAAWALLDLPKSLALLLGANLVVTGPTVIGPLLQHVRPRGPAGAVLKWEGIVIDPVGATLAVLVFEAIVTGSAHADPTMDAIRSFLLIVVVGSVVGFGGAGALLLLLRRYWVPDTLQSAVTLTAVIASFVVATVLRPESGLLAVTIMGVVLANQRSVPIRHIIEFKENIRVILLAFLFILLGARLRPEHLAYITPGAIAFVAVVIIVARPLAVLASTFNSPLTWRERLFVAAVAPRGIVAAAIASVFGARLTMAGFVDAERLVPYTFLVIIVTVLVYGLGARPLARRIGLAEPDPSGLLIAGAHEWSRSLAARVQELGVDVLLVDSNWEHVVAARAAGVPTHFGSIIDEGIEEDLDLGGMGRFLALTSNDAVNALACSELMHLFGRERVFQLQSRERPGSVRSRMGLDRRGRDLFAPGVTDATIQQIVDEGGSTEVFAMNGPGDWPALVADPAAVPLLVIRRGRAPHPITTARPPAPQIGDAVVALVAHSSPA